MSIETPEKETVIVYTVKITNKDTKKIQWYIKHKDLKNVNNKPLSVSAFMENLARTFIQEYIEPKMENGEEEF